PRPLAWKANALPTELLPLDARTETARAKNIANPALVHNHTPTGRTPLTRHAARTYPQPGRSSMPRMTIQQFRAALADPTNSSGALRAYREIARRARTAPRMATGDWVP